MDHFENSKAKEVYSEKGILALSEFEFHKSGVFWVGLIVTVLYVIGLVVGYYKDLFQKFVNDSKLDKMQINPLDSENPTKLLAE